MTPPQYESSEPPKPASDDLVTSDAQAFVTENEITSKPQKASPTQDQAAIIPGPKKPQPAVVYIAITVLFVIGLTTAIILTTDHSHTAGTDAPSSTGNLLTVPTPDSADTKGLSNQARQDIKNCSNTLNAIAGEC